MKGVRKGQVVMRLESGKKAKGRKHKHKERGNKE
jgi:hypothetical protein